MKDRKTIEGFDEVMLRAVLRNIHKDLKAGHEVSVHITPEDLDDLENGDAVITADCYFVRDDDPCEDCKETCSEESCPDSGDDPDDESNWTTSLEVTPDEKELVLGLLKLYSAFLEFTHSRTKRFGKDCED